MSDDFYVGYQPRAAPSLARWWRRLLVVAGILVPLTAAKIALEQQPFAPGLFEFGVERELEGVLLFTPAPLLQVSRPGSAEPSLFLLTRFGKHAADLDPALEHRRVRLSGTLIARGRRTMVEVADGGVTDLGPGTPVAPEALGRLTVVGEIVDSKCWLGVMKPNEGRLHQACASLCLRGGVPAMLRIEDAAGRAEVLLLVDRNGQPLGPQVLDRIAVPVEVSGLLSRLGPDLFVLSTDPASIRRLQPEPT
jgi:hypothetical protein